MADPWKEKRVIGNAELYLGDCIKAIPDERSDPPKRPQKRREAPKKTQA